MNTPGISQTDKMQGWVRAALTLVAVFSFSGLLFLFFPELNIFIDFLVIIPFFIAFLLVGPVGVFASLFLTIVLYAVSGWYYSLDWLNEARIILWIGSLLSVIGTSIVRHRDRELGIQGRRLQLVLDATQEGFFDICYDTNTFFVSSQWYRMLGFAPQAFMLTPERWLSMTHPDDREKISEIVNPKNNESGHLIQFQYRIQGREQNWHWILLRGRWVAWDDLSKPMRFVGTHSEITNQKINEQQVSRQLNIDQLTGLLNWHAFTHEVPILIEEKESVVGDHPWAIVFLDLDDFSSVNEVHGYSVGDEMLKRASMRIQEYLFEGDYLYRIGGDKFALIIRSCSEHFEVTQIVEQLLESIRQPFLIEGSRINSPASAGVCIYPQDGDDLRSLIRNCDLALLGAKNAPKGYCYFRHEMLAESLKRRELVKGITRGIAENQFVVYYQPYYKRSGLAGAEALIRWIDSNGTFHLPSAFIPAAEEAGLIVQLGEWVLERVLSDVKEWQHTLLENECRISVNISAQQLEIDDFHHKVARLLRWHQIDARVLNFEITETSLMKNLEKSRHMVENLSDLGINISIDDFGTGYSSLSYLKGLPINYLKVDKSFVDGLPDEAGDIMIVRAIVSLAHNLGLKVIAEGVEKATQESFLFSSGIDIIQGYYRSMPISALDFDEILKL